MGTNKPEPVEEQIGPHVLVYYTNEGTKLHTVVEGLRADQVLYIAEILIRHANKILDYQEAQARAQNAKGRLVLPQ